MFGSMGKMMKKAVGAPMGVARGVARNTNAPNFSSLLGKLAAKKPKPAVAAKPQGGLPSLFSKIAARKQQKAGSSSAPQPQHML
jgi:hypothetical protein